MATPLLPSGKDADIRVRIERAKKHVIELNHTINAFIAKSNACDIATKRDPQTRELIYYVAKVNDMPPEFSVIAGDAIQNLRSALDHLAYLLVLANRQTPTDSTSFPVCKDAPKYMANRPAVVKHMGRAVANILDTIKPYKGGDDDLWMLHRLNNIHKHRLLVAVGVAVHSVNISPILKRVTPGNFTFSPIFFRPPRNRIRMLQAGDELYRDAPNAEVDENVLFATQVAFGEPQVADGDLVIETIHKFGHLVDGIVTQLATFL